MEVLIRTAAKEDAPSINGLTAQLGYNLSIEQTVLNIRNLNADSNHQVFIAIFKHSIVGWIVVSQTLQLTSNQLAEVHGLIVDANHRGLGIGKSLLLHASQWAAQNGNKKLRLRCNSKRKETHQFYQHLGFKEVKEQKVFEINI